MMMTIFSFTKETNSRKPALPVANKDDVIHYPQETNTNEGSEFLDDAIRIEDLPLVETSFEEGSLYVSSTAIGNIIIKKQN